MTDSPKGFEGFVAASHAVLFEDTDSKRCDVCAQALPESEEQDEDGYGVRGRGMLLWTRGDERRCIETPLCPTCAAAIGVSALSRWEIEEEEG